MDTALSGGRKKPDNIIAPISVGQFIEKKFEHQEAYIGGGLLPKGAIGILGGGSKIGKSIMVNNMSLSLATAKPFLLQFPIPKPVKVLYIQAEIAARSMQDRLRKMVNSENIDHKILDQNFYLINHKGIKLDRRLDLQIVGEIIANYGIEVVIIDPLYKFHSGDENRSGDMARFFDSLDSLITDHGCSIVIVHHFGRQSQDNPRHGAQQLRGSTTIFDYADSYISLNRKSGKEPRSYLKATFELRNEEDPDPMYLYRNPNTLWYEVLADASDSKVTIHDVINILTDLEGQAKRQELIDALKEKTGGSRRKIDDVLAIAETTNKIKSMVLREQGNPKMFYLPGQ